MPTTGPERPVQEEKRTFWSLPPEIGTRQLIDDLGREFVLEPGAKEQSRLSWYDTFDWRLYRKGLLLHHDGRGWELVDRNSAEVLARVNASAPGAGPLFCSAFPGGRLRSLLQPVIEMRALLPLFVNERSVQCYRVLNSDRKTVAGALFEEYCLPGSGFHGRLVELQGVRGYNRNFRSLSRFFTGYGHADEAGPGLVFETGVQATGRFPLDYGSGFSPDLRTEMTARQAMLVIYRQLYETMQLNEGGIREDIDTEFLHDFRVAVRRTRSGLGLVKNIFPDAATAMFRREFAWLGTITGPTRDLDVCLLDEGTYRAVLAERLQNGLAPFFTDIRLQRQEEWRILVRRLASGRYAKLMSAWGENLADRQNEEVAGNTGRPVVKVAAKILAKRFAKVMRQGEAIKPSSLPEDLHRLRIQCKKLRYVLEFFSSLFPAEESGKAIKQLKRLQTNLGEFNDLAVQQNMLRTYLDNLKPGSKKNQEMAASLGGLLSGLFLQQQRVRSEFAERFREFSRPGTRKIFAALSGGEGGRK